MLKHQLAQVEGNQCRLERLGIDALDHRVSPINLRSRELNIRSLHGRASLVVDAILFGRQAGTAGALICRKILIG